jgi:pimeloyl-ACP methyl ester carboxylesterase
MQRREDQLPYALSPDGIQIYFEETGRGTPFLFLHEYGGDMRGWEAQLRHFGKRHRCIAFNARGYPPSEVPEDPGRYSPELAVGDAIAVLDHLGLEKAHVVGLAMGSFTTLFLGLSHPERALSLVVAGCGYGADPRKIEDHHAASDAVARLYEEQGSARAANTLAAGPARIQYMLKDPRGWQEFARRLAEHSATGAALVQRGVLRARTPLFALERQLAALSLPTLLVAGDEDDPCLAPNIFLKRAIATSALVVLPRSGHTLNLEEPELFNRVVENFIGEVEAGVWRARDPRSRFPGFASPLPETETAS